MAPDQLVELPVHRLAQFVLQCARDDSSVLSRSNIDAIATAPAPRRMSVLAAAVAVAGVLAASSAIALYGYDHGTGTRLASAANGSGGAPSQSGFAATGTHSEVAHDISGSRDPSFDIASTAAVPANPAKRSMAPGQENSPAAMPGTLAASGGPPAASLPDAAAGTAPELTFRQSAPTGDLPAVPVPPGPAVEPRLATAGNAQGPTSPPGAVQDQPVREPSAATLPQAGPNPGPRVAAVASGEPPGGTPDQAAAVLETLPEPAASVEPGLAAVGNAEAPANPPEPAPNEAAAARETLPAAVVPTVGPSLAAAENPEAPGNPPKATPDQAAAAPLPPAATPLQAVPAVEPRLASVGNPAEPGNQREATPEQAVPEREPAAALHQPSDAEAQAVPAHPAKPPQRHAMYHPYRRPARRYVYYRYYQPGPAAMLAQFANNVRRNLDAIFH